MTGIVLEHVSASYDRSGRILKDLDFRIPPGSLTAVLGRNGCGKTTLLRVLTGILPHEGEIRIDGTPLRAMKRREIASVMALLPQMSHAGFSYRVYETVALGRYLRAAGLLGSLTEQDRRVIDACLDTMELSSLRDRRLFTLSGGQLQRVFLARAFAQETPYLLLDEPTNHLDPGVQQLLTDKLLSWSRETPEGTGTRHTLIGVFHDIGIALMLADTLVLLKEGRLVACGPKEQLLSDGALDEAYGMDVAGFLKRQTEAIL